MIDLFLFCILASFGCIGLQVATWDGMILQPLVPYLDLHCPEKLKKPLYSCATCMASIWGTIFYTVAIHDKWYLLLIVIPILAGLNTFGYKLLIRLCDLIAEQEKHTPIKGYRNELP